ncbi:GIY-YIG nuclease family protein [Ruegeria sp. HKCCA5426]|uniref:GIY-YIG nuclease family protein n=1 Tax=Ruegeria sp. HKCCA5426 TaxID=2682985 RepID=UPI001488128B|nr:GIY-YIG nuclease family protein [Ruegeria sp. HKCCA5426]
MASSSFYSLWKRQVFVRHWHDDIQDLLEKHGFGSGIYLIGCAGEIVYIGQSWDLSRRTIESLGNHYHKVSDTSLPWSLAIAPCAPSEMDERESTAIRAFAPKFNTSILSVAKSLLRMPKISDVAPVFYDQDKPCGAFDAENMKRQMANAATMPSPPWAKKRVRKKVKRPNYAKLEIPIEPVMRSKEETSYLLRTFGVSLEEPLRFAINLCDDGSVVTREGEYLGRWEMDEHVHPVFFPDGFKEPLFRDPFVGFLCKNIEDWYAAKSQSNNSKSLV